MRLTTASQVVSAFLALTPLASAGHHGHASIARKHMHHKKNNLVKRGECQFPTNKGLVSVTPDAQNAGWAMSPDQPCKPGMYCPYACPPGQLMAQWDPKATSYSYPASMVSSSIPSMILVGEVINFGRMVDFIAMMMERLRSHSRISRCAMTALEATK